MKEDLVKTGRWAMDMFMGYHWNRHTKTFAEYLHPVYKTPYEDDKGRIICDPGHTAEGVGFFSEFHRYLPDDDATSFRYKKDTMLPVLTDILKFVHAYGYSDNGVMYKNIDLKTMAGAADVIDDSKEYRTAPWWNIRECSAAAIRLFALTGEDVMWDIYKKSFNACYQNYPNMNIGGLMLQTLDADTMKPLPFHPATGNLDPMHSPRAREREIEALEECNSDK
jgi:mannose/cellobiose epimerase-like protein (N-acyl-D-glucosamine 2-epimerase family)